MQAEVGKIKIVWGSRKLVVTIEEAKALLVKLQSVIAAVEKIENA